VNYTETVPTKIAASPTRIPNTTVEPPVPHVLLQLEAPPVFPEVWVGVELDSDDDNIEDKDEGGGGNEIDVGEDPTLQNL